MKQCLLISLFEKFKKYSACFKIVRFLFLSFKRVEIKMRYCTRSVKVLGSPKYKIFHFCLIYTNRFSLGGNIKKKNKPQNQQTTKDYSPGSVLKKATSDGEDKLVISFSFAHLTVKKINHILLKFFSVVPLCYVCICQSSSQIPRNVHLEHLNVFTLSSRDGDYGSCRDFSITVIVVSPLNVMYFNNDGMTVNMSWNACWITI